jgi:uncharacterized protein (DUF427 family)
MTTQAFWNGQLIAASDACVSVEGNAYFPPESLEMRYFKASDHTSMCPWKGTANYFDVVVGGKTNANAAWIYKAPKEAAANIAGRVAFWKGVEVKGG